MIDQIMKGIIALITFVATAWFFYIAILSAEKAWKKPKERPITIFFGIVALGGAVLLAWLGSKLLM